MAELNKFKDRRSLANQKENLSTLVGRIYKVQSIANRVSCAADRRSKNYRRQPNHLANVIFIAGQPVVDSLYQQTAYSSHYVIGAPGIDREGVKHALGVAAGSTENRVVVRDLLAALCRARA